MHFGNFAIDGGLLLAILWFFGWPVIEYFEQRQSDKKRLAALAAMHAERMRAMEQNRPIPDPAPYKAY